jgi:hypothetical protein
MRPDHAGRQNEATPCIIVDFATERPPFNVAALSPSPRSRADYSRRLCPLGLDTLCHGYTPGCVGDARRGKIDGHRG